MTLSANNAPSHQSMSVLSLITARGGSKRVPNKNTRSLGGKTLIARTLEQAHRSGICDRIIVSTDSVTIAEVAKDHGGEVPFLSPRGTSDGYISAYFYRSACANVAE